MTDIQRTVRTFAGRLPTRARPKRTVELSGAAGLSWAQGTEFIELTDSPDSSDNRGGLGR